jgi:signal transduction histidine kinase/CheY-like chemotaxis protein
LFIFASQAAIAIQNARLYQIQKRIQRQERMAAVGQLAAGIAHDFNNILTSIIGFAELLQANPELPLSAQADLERITKQGQRAARLVRQILDFSSQTITEKRPLDLKLSLKEMIKLLERTIPEDIRISLADAPILPTLSIGMQAARTTEAEAQEYLVTADLAQLQQAITNLALNARDAMPEGGRLSFQLAHLSLVPPEAPPISGMPPGNWIRLSVSDTGIGIPPHLHTQIFEPFFTTKEVGQGTGLGLAQVYGIIKQHEGYINVESELGAGATFNIYLPALASPGGSPSAEEPCGGTIPRGKGEMILLVEDDASVRYIGTTMLQHLGYRVLTASQGQEALQIYEQHQAEIKVVLTDMTMPEMGGQALAALLYQKNASLKLVMLTGYPLKTGAAELQPPGVQDWLQKPLKLDQLAQTLYRILK